MVVCVVSACLFDSGCSIYDHNILENAKRDVRDHSAQSDRRADLSEFLQPTFMRSAGGDAVTLPDASHTPAAMTESVPPSNPTAPDAGTMQDSRRLGQLADDDAGVLTQLPSPSAPDAGQPVEPPPIARASPACRGRIGFVSPGGHCYVAFATPLNWHQSRDECHKLGGHLATVASELENKFVARIPIEAPTWMGLSNFGATSFSWVTGEELSFTSWQSGAPRMRSEAAMVILPGTGLWSDRPPNEQHPGLCELKND